MGNAGREQDTERWSDTNSLEITLMRETRRIYFERVGELVQGHLSVRQQNDWFRSSRPHLSAPVFIKLDEHVLSGRRWQASIGQESPKVWFFPSPRRACAHVPMCIYNYYVHIYLLICLYVCIYIYSFIIYSIHIHTNQKWHSHARSCLSCPRP